MEILSERLRGCKNLCLHRQKGLQIQSRTSVYAPRQNCSRALTCSLLKIDDGQRKAVFGKNKTQTKEKG